MSAPQSEHIWICDECRALLTADDVDSQDEAGWGHSCKAHPRSKKDHRCEAYWQEYEPVGEVPE
jgi:hypothetical protein